MWRRLWVLQGRLLEESGTTSDLTQHVHMIAVSNLSSYLSLVENQKYTPTSHKFKVLVVFIFGEIHRHGCCAIAGKEDRIGIHLLILISRMGKIAVKQQEDVG